MDEENIKEDVAQRKAGINNFPEITTEQLREFYSSPCSMSEFEEGEEE